MAFSWASFLSLPTHWPQRWGKGEEHSQQLLLTLSKPLARTEAVNTAQPLSSPSSIRGPRDSAHLHKTQLCLTVDWGGGSPASLSSLLTVDWGEGVFSKPIFSPDSQSLHFTQLETSIPCMQRNPSASQRQSCLRAAGSGEQLR